MKDVTVIRAWDEVRSLYPKIHKDTIRIMVAERIHDTPEAVSAAMRRAGVVEK